MTPAEPLTDRKPGSDHDRRPPAYMLSFPRTEWETGPYVRAMLENDAELRTLWAGREASRQWAADVDGSLINDACYILSVFDKVHEM